MDKGILLKMFQRVCKAAGICFWDWDLQSGEMVFQNFQDFFKEEHATGRVTLEEWERYILPEDLEETRAAIARCTEYGEDCYVATMRMRIGDGSVIWAQDRGWVVESHPDGRPARLMGLQQNISHIKEVERELHGKQMQLDLIADISGLIPWEWDCLNEKLYTGPQFFRELGYADNATQDHLTFDWFSIVHPDDKVRVQAAMDAYLARKADEYREEVRLCRDNGEYVWFITSGVVSEWKNGLPLRLVGGLFNIDQLKRTEEGLAAALKENRKFTERLRRENAVTEENLRLSKGDVYRQRRLLRVVNEIAMDMLHVSHLDIEKTVKHSLKKIGQSANADRVYILRNCKENGEFGFRLLHGWHENGDETEIWCRDTFLSYSAFGVWEKLLRQGKSINAHVHTLPDAQRAFFEKLGVQSVLILPVQVGKEFWGTIYFGDTQKVRLSDEPELETLQSSGVLMVLGLMRASTVMRLQKAMEEAQASTRAKTMILANVSHEMKTPMNAILGMSAIAKKHPDNIQEYLEKIDEATRRLLGVVNDMLDIATLSSGKFVLDGTRFTFSDLLNNVMAKNSPAALAKHQELVVNVNSCPEQAFLSDASRLERVINCLVSNAIKFTGNGGRISVEVGEKVRNASCSSEVLITVQDNGIGMNESDLPLLFLPFEQAEKMLARSFEGTGLGLAIVHGIVEAMGGTISAVSEPGTGSVFSVSLTLPHAPEEQQDKDVGTAKGMGIDVSTLRGKHILLAEDNEINREIIKELLQDYCTIHCAENGQEAYNLVRLHPGLYDMILMDIHMPIMDGYEASSKIRALPSRVPIIAVTANDLPEDIEKRRHAGMNGYVGKPIDLEPLLRSMARNL